MRRAVLRDLRAHPGRLLMTLVAIVLGVAFVVATWVVSDSAAASVASENNRTDIAVMVTPRDPTGQLSTSDIARLATISGASRVSGVAVGYTALVQSNGKLGDTYLPDTGGTGWDGTGRFTLLTGRAPVADGEVALEREAAGDFGVGAIVRVLDRNGASTMVTVVGTFAYHKTAREFDPAVAYAPETALRRLGPGYAWAELDGAAPDTLAAAATSALGPGVAVRTADDLAAEQATAASEEAEAVRNFLLAFAGVALLAGMFVIANTFTMLVAQRTRHFALLRAVGARRAQVRRAVLTEAVIVGLIGATVGVVSGVGLGWLAMVLLRRSGELVLFTVSPLSIVVGYLVGIVVTVVSAYGSARRGALVAPVAALGTDAALPRRSLVVRTVAGVVLLGAGVALVVATSQSDLTDTERAIGMGGALLGCVGVLLLAPVLATLVLTPLATLVARRGSAISRLAARNAIRDPRRTAATASALMIGLTLVTAFATVGASLTNTMTRAISHDIPTGVSVVRSAVQWSPLPAPVLDQVAAAPGVTAIAAPVTIYGAVAFGSHQAGLPVTAVEAAGIGTALTPLIAAGTASVADGGVLLPADFANRNGIAVGDRVTVTTEANSPTEPEGSVTGRVNGLYDRSEALRGAVVDKTLLPPSAVSYVAAVFVAGPSQASLDTLFASRPDVLVQSRQQMIDGYTSNIDLALNIVYGLLGAAIIIAVFGVVNTMALSVLERTREIGVFRAVGATRRLVRRSIRRESVVIATYGGALGIGVGILLGGVMQHVIMETPIFSLDAPLSFVVGALAAMVVVGTLAAWWPARRAARTDILAAIATT